MTGYEDSNWECRIECRQVCILQDLESNAHVVRSVECQVDRHRPRYHF